MKARVAVASTDGKAVNQHFGRADSFLIFDVGDGGFAYVERRRVPPFCAGGDHEGRSGGEVSALLGALADCRAVVAARIGAGAAGLLDEHGIDSIESRGAIEDVLARIIESKALG
ncbi:MAG: hypothetical protein LBG62_02030 [Candidatus Methanoplasma sp.]|nr:hypothetical protein [Candidatus Methanoplasma sp.]